MNTNTSPQVVVPTDNLLVVQDNGTISSHRVSQVYGRTLLGAMALRMNSLPFKILHTSFLSVHEPLTLNNIRNAAQAIAPRDSLMFIDDSRKILSCRIKPDYGMALLQSLQRAPEEASQTRAVLSHTTATQASAVGNNPDNVMTGSSQHASQELRGPYANASSSSLSTSGTPTTTLGVLSDEILSSANRQPYDRDWMSMYSINETCLTGPSSKHKLDFLVRCGAVKAGDKLCVPYHPDSSGPVVIVGEVLQTGKSGRLDIRIAPAREDFDGVLRDCKSPKDIISGMDQAFQIQRHSKVSEAWKLVSVMSEDGKDVGSLWRVRQAYQVFGDSMTEWGGRNRQTSP